MSADSASITARSRSHTPVLSAHGLAKSFGQTKALTDGSLEVAPGEVVALLGENGSGKSTMVKLLSGVYKPDAGALHVGGREVRFGSPRQALAAGVVTIFQEILVGRDRSVLDNLWLGNGSPRRSKRLDDRRRSRAQEVWWALAGEGIDFNLPVGELSLMQQQICVVARALLREPRLLVLDESTSTLDVSLRDRLFAELRRRCDAGMGALFISHRMDEVMTLADRHVALRMGAVVGTRRRGETTPEELLQLISGADVNAVRRRPAPRALGAGPAMTAEAVVLRQGRPAFDVTVARGEVLGLAGLEGHGQDELLRSFAGLHVPVSGRIQQRTSMDAQPVRDYRSTVARGVVYVPRDRKVDGMADVLSILDNYGMPTLSKDTSMGLLSRRRTRRRFREDARTVNFVPGRQDSIGRLSGGNQQKVIVARWLAARPDVILLNDPTRGVDLKTKHELYDVFRALAEAGTTVVVLSSEVDELVHLVDRVLVFHDGGLSAELDGDDVTPDNIVAAYFGGSARSVSVHTPSARTPSPKETTT